MSHHARRAAVELPLALHRAGGRDAACAWVEDMRRCYRAGLQTRAGQPRADRETVRAALERVAECARGAFARYNGETAGAPASGAPEPEARNRPNQKMA